MREVKPEFTLSHPTQTHTHVNLFPVVRVLVGKRPFSVLSFSCRLRFCGIDNIKREVIKRYCCVNNIGPYINTTMYAKKVKVV
jgi:hypothetical protein